MHTKTVFLDRDGVINKKMPEGTYVTGWHEFHFLPNTISAVARLVQNGFRVFVITNQRGISRGVVSEDALSAIHTSMEFAFRDARAPLSGIYVCPHDEGSCECRKPLPGLFLKAANDYGIDLEEAYTIGDSASDIEAGKRAGTKTILLAEDSGRNDHRGIEAEADFSCRSLEEAVAIILKKEGVEV